MTLGRDTAITYYGHSTFRIDTPGGKRLLIDPWVGSNSRCPDELKPLGPLDYVLITHGHDDHAGDALEVLRESGATAVAIVEIAAWLATHGVEKIAPMNKGGTQELEGIKVTCVHADHTSSISDGEGLVYGGEPCGYVLELENGFRLYHAGDTALFGDMRLISELYRPEVVMLPIGDHFTMGPREAAYALRLLGATRVIPMHYATFPQLTGTPVKLREEAADIPDLEIYALEPGETLA